MGAGVKKSKAKKMQRKAASTTSRNVKGRNKVAKVSRTDKPKNPGPSTRRRKPGDEAPVRGTSSRSRKQMATGDSK
jgi:hypothetical protein